MTDLINKTITEIVSEHNAAADVFDKYHLDFCRNGDKILKNAVKEANIAVDYLIKDLEFAISNDPSDNINFNSLTITEVSELLRSDYHDFLRHKISEIATLSRKAQLETKDERIETIHELIMSMFNHLAPHMISEEKVLFPYLEYMEHTLNKGKVPKPASFGKLKKSVSSMLDDHEASAGQLDELRALTNNYNCTETENDVLCNYIKELREFDRNLRMHIFIENNVLFKKARVLEDKILNN